MEPVARTVCKNARLKRCRLHDSILWPPDYKLLLSAFPMLRQCNQTYVSPVSTYEIKTRQPEIAR
jgi:hypothetical protein